MAFDDKSDSVASPLSSGRYAIFFRLTSIGLAAGALLSACAQPVTIPESDETPPSVELRLFSGGEELARLEPEAGTQTVSVLSTLDQNTSLLAVGEDAGGVQELELRAFTGGELSDPSGGTTNVLTETGDRSDPVDRLVLGSRPVFAERGGTLLLQTKAKDFSGNPSGIVRVEIRQLTPAKPELQANPNPLLQGRTATLSWSFDGSNVAAAEITDDSGTVVVADALTPPRQHDVSPSQDTTYTLDVETTLPQGQGPVQDQLLLQVPQPQVSLTADKGSVDAGTSVLFSYDGQGIEELRIDGLLGAPTDTLPGTVTQVLNETDTYTAEGLIDGQVVADDSVQVQVRVPQTITLRERTQTSRCAATQTGLLIDTQDVTEAFGTYTTVERVEVNPLDADDEFVNAYYGGANGQHVRIGAGANRPNPTNTTDGFDGQDVRTTWCFQYGSSIRDANDPLFVTFTLSP